MSLAGASGYGRAPGQRRAFLLLVAWIANALLGCTTSRPLLRHGAVSAAPPKEFVLLCRPNVLQMQDGSRVPGVVAQVFLMGPDLKGPVAVPRGSFDFVAEQVAGGTPRASSATQSWQFTPDDAPRHLVDHPLGPCYVFWLPCPASPAAERPLIVHGSFESAGQRVVSSPVKVMVPASG